MASQPLGFAGTTHVPSVDSELLKGQVEYYYNLGNTIEGAKQQKLKSMGLVPANLIASNYYNPYDYAGGTITAQLQIDAENKRAKLRQEGRYSEADQVRTPIERTYDFILGDDIKTLFNPNTGVLEKALAGVNILGTVTPGKVISKGFSKVKYVELLGFKFTSKAAAKYSKVIKPIFKGKLQLIEIPYKGSVVKKFSVETRQALRKMGFNGPQINEIESFAKQTGDMGKHEIKIYKIRRQWLLETGTPKKSGVANIYYKRIDETGHKLNFGKIYYDKGKNFKEYSDKIFSTKTIPYRTPDESEALRYIFGD